MRAITLSGGGSRGAYQVGVWQALRELGIDFDIVTGTSVGAINGAMMVQGAYEETRGLWEKLDISNIVAMETGAQGELPVLTEPSGLISFIRSVMENGGVDVEPLHNLLQSVFDEDAFRASPVDYALVTVQYPSMKSVVMRKKDIPQGMVTQYILASAACFPAFKPFDIDGVRHVDGAYYDNLPLNLAADLGAKEIIAVDLKTAGITRKLRKKDVTVKYISSGRPLGPFLKFDAELSKRNIRLGYLDAMKSFGELDGTLFTFEKGECEKRAKQLFPSYLGLLRDIGLGGREGGYRAYRYAAKRRLKHHIREIRERAGAPGMPGATVCGEIAGDIFGLDELKIYTSREFDALLAEAFAQTGEEEHSGLLAILNFKRDPRDIATSLKNINRRHLVRYIYKHIQDFYKGERNRADILGMAGLAPPEFLSAAYLYALAR